MTLEMTIAKCRPQEVAKKQWAEITSNPIDDTYIHAFHQNYMQRPLSSICPGCWSAHQACRHHCPAFYVTCHNCQKLTRASLPADHSKVDATEAPSINCLCSSSGSYSHHTTQPPQSFQMSSCIEWWSYNDCTSRFRSRHLCSGTPPPPAVERTPKQSTSVPNNAMGCQWIHHANPLENCLKIIGTKQLQTFFEKYQGCSSRGKLPKGLYLSSIPNLSLCNERI